jgi:hypothetical protein
MGRKKMTDAARIRAYFTKNPDAKPADAVKALGVKPANVYVVRNKMKNPVTKIILNEAIPRLRQAMAEGKAKAANWGEPRLCPLENEGDTTPAWGTLAMSISSQPTTITLGAVQEPIDMVNDPPHYKSGGIDTIDFIEAKELNYRLGNVIKYITRADRKGSRQEDLKKALWYLQREIEKG